METDEQKIKPKPEEMLYILTFKGGDTLPFHAYAPARDIQKAFPFILESIRLKAPLLIDNETGTQYLPVFIGTKTNTQKIIPAISWGINGEVHNYMWSGFLISDQGGIILAYLLPGKTRKFFIKDKENEFRIKEISIE